MLDKIQREREVPDGDMALRRDVTVIEDVRRHNAAVHYGGER